MATDNEGHRYVAMTYNEADKTHHGVNSKEKPKAPRKLCPVKSFEKYLSKLNPDNEALFQKPLSKYHKDGAVWYGKTPIGVNQLYEFMPRLSAEASLSKRYTNHYIRAMVATKYVMLVSAILESCQSQVTGMYSPLTHTSNHLTVSDVQSVAF